VHSHTLPNTTTPVYFTAGHSLFTFHIDYPDFVKSLYYNLLLQPDGIAFCDHSFISDFFGRELLRRPKQKSWMALALQNGLITTFVKPGFSGFRAQLARQREYNARGMPPYGEELAQQLDQLKIREPRVIHRNYGLAFRERLEQIVQSPSSAFISGIDKEWASDLQAFWESDTVKAIRFDDFPAALRLTEESGNTGLQLAKLFQATRYRLFGDYGDVTDNISSLLGRIDDKEERRTIGRFYKIACDAFNVAMAESIECAPNSPKFDYDFASVQGFNQPMYDKSNDPPDIIALRLKLPSISVLRQSDAIDLVVARDLGEKVAYFDTFRQWQLHPTEEYAGRVRDALVLYGEALVNEFGGSDMAEELKGLVFNFGKEDIRQHVIAVTAGGIAYVTTGEPLAGLGTFIYSEAAKVSSSLVLSNSWRILRAKSSADYGAEVRIKPTGDVSLI